MRFVVLLSLFLGTSAAAAEWPKYSGPYVGQKPPGRTAQIFAPGVISLAKARELNSVFSPDGAIFMFSRVVDGAFKMYFSSQDKDGVWSEPRLAGPSRTYPGHSDVDMAFSPNGKRVYFISDRPLAGYSLERHNIWFSDVGPHGLMPPVALGPEINGPDHDLYPSIVADGSLYYSTTRDDSLGERDSYRAQFRDGAFEKPVNLGSAINSQHAEGDIFVNSTETILIHNASGRPNGRGKGDLYVSFSKGDGNWTPGVHLGPEINTADNEYCPVLTPDGKYFFFTRGNDIMWIDAKILEAYR
ncbi:MAG: hypothetical protein AAF654_13220 [Myxococcota bacterium]